MLHGLVQSQNICSKSEGMSAAAGLEMRVVVGLSMGRSGQTWDNQR